MRIPPCIGRARQAAAGKEGEMMPAYYNENDPGAAAFIRAAEGALK